ncbi:MAG: hypothetical protein ACJ762_11805 [Solirubrobacteraceae bacterium]
MKTLPVLLAAAALFGAGCGGDDNSSDSGSDSGARGYAETGQAVSDVCTRANAEINKLAADLDGTAKHDAPTVEKIIGTSDKFLGELREIKPDPKLQETFDKYVDAVAAGQERAREVLKAAQSGNDENYRSAAEAADTDKTTHPLARALGATECAKSS